MKALIAITKSEIPIEDIWKLSVNVPSIFSINTTSANDKYLPEYIDGLIEKFSNINYDSLSTISETKEELRKFVDNMENITELIYEEAQKNKVLYFFTQKLKVEIAASPRYSMISTQEQMRINHQNAMRLPTPHSLTAHVSQTQINPQGNQIQINQTGQIQQMNQQNQMNKASQMQVNSQANQMQINSQANQMQINSQAGQILQMSQGNIMQTPQVNTSSTILPLAYESSSSSSIQIPSIPTSSQVFALSQSVPITPKQRSIFRNNTQGMKLEIPDEE